MHTTFSTSIPTTQAHTSAVDDGANIRFDRVGFRYTRDVEILKDISFSLPRGSMTFVTGSSGAGKTTLLKLIYLHMRPSRGLITVFGQDTSQIDRKAIPTLKRRMGVVLQDFDLIDHLNVFENVALPLRISGRKRADYKDDVRGLLKWVGLGARAHALPQMLSGGEKQRAAIARAVIAKPEILIADEPTGNVDQDVAKRLIHLFKEMNRLGTTVVIATHNMDLISADANVLALNNGQISSTNIGTSMKL